MNVQLAGFGIINSKLCSVCLEKPETIMHFFFWSVNLLSLPGITLEIGFPQNYKPTFSCLGFINYLVFKKIVLIINFLKYLMLVARFFIYRCKYSKSKPNMSEYFNEFNMIKKSEYLIAKRNKSFAKHYKKWRNICDFN